jgi:phosphoglycerate dehydrogenase-like enzyme
VTAMRCVLIDPYATRNSERLQTAVKTPWEIVTAARTDSPATLAEALGTAEVAISQGWDATANRYAPRLRLLQLPNAGTDAVDWSVVPDGCAVANVYEHEIPVAEFVMLALLETRIGIRQLDRSFRDGDWSMSHRMFGPLHGELAGATVGLVGYGRIARAVALRARAFGMTVIAVSRTRPDDDALAWAGDMTSLDTMLPRCDFLVISCPLTNETSGVINERRLALLPKQAVVVNVARGEIIDEAALYKALVNDTIAGAALDVWWRYPTDGDPAPSPSRYAFSDLSNVLMAPHVSAWTEGMLSRRWKMIAANLDRFALGIPLLNIVRQAKGAEMTG